MKKLILISVLITLIAGCKKNDPSDLSSNLIGKWSWIQSCPGTGNTGCWSPGSHYPNYDISFGIDYTYKVFHLDTLKSSSKFHTFKFSNDQNQLVNLIEFESGSNSMYQISHDTLQITNSEGVLTITSRYKRIE